MATGGIPGISLGATGPRPITYTFHGTSDPEHEGGTIKYDCKHEYDSKNNTAAFKARMPLALEKDVEDLKQWSTVRVNTTCLICDMVNEVYVKVSDFLGEKLVPDEGRRKSLEQMIDRIKGEDKDFYNADAREIAKDVHDVTEAKLRDIGSYERFFDKWPLPEQGIKYWRGNRGQYPIIQLYYPLNEAEKTLLCELLTTKDLHDAAKFAIENPSENVVGYAEDWATSPKTTEQNLGFYREWRSEYLKGKYPDPQSAPQPAPELAPQPAAPAEVTEVPRRPNTSFKKREGSTGSELIVPQVPKGS